RPTQAWAEGGRLGNSQQPKMQNSRRAIAALGCFFNGAERSDGPKKLPRMSAPAVWWLRGCSPAEGQDCFVI
ncbi:hypothetical protein, partial [Delftia acidovorans]|uniref:hypothetical protein n=1 Tax=Delftia acidovorans TaxID=80866 RepID=UPI001C0D85ED